MLSVTGATIARTCLRAFVASWLRVKFSYHKWRSFYSPHPNPSPDGEGYNVA